MREKIDFFNKSNIAGNSIVFTSNLSAVKANIGSFHFVPEIKGNCIENPRGARKNFHFRRQFFMLDLHMKKLKNIWKKSREARKNFNLCAYPSWKIAYLAKK